MRMSPDHLPQRDRRRDDRVPDPRAVRDDHCGSINDNDTNNNNNK